MRTSTAATALALFTTMFAGCGGDKVLEGPLKSCQVYIDSADYGCTLCGDAVLDSERVNTENQVVTRSDKKDFGYESYDDNALEACALFTRDGVYAVLEETTGCEALGYDQNDIFTVGGVTESFFHDGSCDTTSSGN